ncbi:methionine/alanine import family NSS transporter small subunit [Brevibacterium paucivorans]
MSTPAIIMMVLAIVTLWGGLGAAIVHLVRHPDASGS